VPPPAAWRTGLTLENVLLRLDAFEHLQLPVELLHGSIGRIQAQVGQSNGRGDAPPRLAVECLPHGHSSIKQSMRTAA